MDVLIKSFQDYAKSSPLGIAYSGATDGYMNTNLTSSLTSLQNTIKDKLSKSSNPNNKTKAESFTIISGNKIVSTVNAVKTIIDDLNKEVNQNIKSAQEIYNSNPFGLSYSGPKDGAMNPDFASKLKELEAKIAEFTGAQIAGSIISGENLTTNANDLSKTFSLIKSYQDFISHK